MKVAVYRGRTVVGINSLLCAAGGEGRRRGRTTPTSKSHTSNIETKNSQKKAEIPPKDQKSQAALSRCLMISDS